MFNCFSAFLAIIGTVIGSGFISGKEVVVFFSRFGCYSFPCIVIVFFLFFFLLKFFLFNGENLIKKLEKSKVFFLLNTILCLIFSSAMFAGAIDMASGLGKTFNMVFVLLLLFICALVSRRGMSSLEKLNFILVPIMTLVLIIAVVSRLFCGGDIQTTSNGLGGMSIIYCILYVILNTSNSCVLLARLGERMTIKQKTRVAFISSLVLCLILTMLNIVLLFSPRVFNEEMPLLELFSGRFRQVLEFAIMIGCLTTLFSLIYSCSTSMRGMCKNECLIYFVSVIMPFILSLLGFGFIVTQLYPLASVMGVFLLADLTFIPFFKWANKKIHSSGKQTK